MRTHSRNKSLRARGGFTLRDLIAIIVIVLLLAMLAAPLLVQLRAGSRRQFCQARMIKVATALLRHEDAAGRFPGFRQVQARRADGRQGHCSWVFPILPYLDADPKRKDPGPWNRVFVEYGPTGDEERRGQTPELRLTSLICPASPPAPRVNRLTCVVNGGMPDLASVDHPPDWPENGVFLDRLSTQPFEMTLEFILARDGANQTLLLSENLDAGSWTDSSENRVAFLWEDRQAGDPERRLLRINENRGLGDGETAYARASSGHVGGVNAAFCSGRTQFISETIDEIVWAQMMTVDDTSLRRAGGDDPVLAPFGRAP